MSDQRQNNESGNKGKNLGQGLAGINDNQRRELMGNGDSAPTQDQRQTLGKNGSRPDENQGSAEDRKHQR